MDNAQSKAPAVFLGTHLVFIGPLEQNVVASLDRVAVRAADGVVAANQDVARAAQQRGRLLGVGHHGAGVHGGAVSPAARDAQAVAAFQ